MNRLKVLVFDDSEIHRESARLLLAKDYDLTVVGTYDEAQEALRPHINYDKASKAILPELLKKAGIESDFSPKPGGDTVKRDVYFALESKSYTLAKTYPDFDIVLTDLLVPASKQAQGDEGRKFVGQEMPLGTTIALLALCSGIKKVAVVTDMNHHHHPASAAFDWFGGCVAESIEIICTNRTFTAPIDEKDRKLVSYEFLESEEGKVKYPRLDYGQREGITFGKDWLEIIKRFRTDLTDEDK